MELVERKSLTTVIKAGRIHLQDTQIVFHRADKAMVCLSYLPLLRALIVCTQEQRMRLLPTITTTTGNQRGLYLSTSLEIAFWAGPGVGIIIRNRYPYRPPWQYLRLEDIAPIWQIPTLLRHLPPWIRVHGTP